MQIMLRDRSLAELMESLRGKRVLIWTCNTCARLCDVGGSSNAQRLATALRSEGIEVVSVLSAKASCVTSAVVDLKKGLKVEFDVILALTCDAGSRVGSTVFGKDSINPVRTIGTGYLAADGKPVLMDRINGYEVPLVQISSDEGLPLGPF